MASAAEFRHWRRFAVDPGPVRRACDHALRLSGRALRHTQTSSRGESGAYQRAPVSGHSRGVGV
jgi:hypothetical protein